MKISSGTIARTACLILALINQTLIILGHDSIPIADDDIYQLISIVFTIGTAIAAWWKNNSFTSSAINADKLMFEMKANIKRKG